MSHLVLNDVPDYAGFIATIARACKPCRRIVLTLNNPYSAVLREKTPDYSESGNGVVYQGLAESGVRVYYYHRTLEEYILAFRNNGMLLRTLQDVRPTEEMVRTGRPQAKWYHFPFLMVLEFVTTDSSLRSE